jgi:hypothetical protein
LPQFSITECATNCNIVYKISREENRLKVFENRVLRRILGPKRDEVTGGWRKCMMSCMVCTLHPVLLV